MGGGKLVNARTGPERNGGDGAAVVNKGHELTILADVVHHNLAVLGRQKKESL